MPMYFNPSSAMVDPQTFMNRGPFGVSMPSVLGYQQAATNQQTMAPFLQQQYGIGQSEAAIQAEKAKEAMDPSTLAAYVAQQRANTATSQQTELTAPWKGALERGEISGKLGALPFRNEAERQSAIQALSEVKGKPAGQLLSMFAAHAPDMMAAKTDEQRQAIHKQVLEQFHDQYPGLQVPSQLENWHGDLPDLYHSMFSMQVNTPDFFQKLGIQAPALASQERQAATRAKGEVEAAGVHAGAQLKGVEEQIEAGKTPEMQLLQIRKGLANPNISAADRAGLEARADPLGRQVVLNQLNTLYKPMDPNNPILATDFGKQLYEQNQKSRAIAQIQLERQNGVRPYVSELRAALVAGAPNDAMRNKWSSAPDSAIKEMWNKTHPDLPAKD